MSPTTSIQLMTDAVIAEYIHEISVRHHRRLAGEDTGSQSATSPVEVTSAGTPERPELRRATL